MTGTPAEQRAAERKAAGRAALAEARATLAAARQPTVTSDAASVNDQEHNQDVR